ncbi:MAG: PrsW family intramembrane metalloprotease [Spirochaetaceae bacterium]|jgi:hypothetical protein|nr:PrsW family intramembrane metalloprotease [Spirochaetaceae bacterium]
MALAVLIAVLPPVIAWFWLRRTTNISAITFLFALAAGVLSLALAAFVQTVLPEIKFDTARISLPQILIRTALVEEGSRIALLALLFKARFFNGGRTNAPDAALAGMIAGLAFAAVETLSFAAASSVGLIRLLRIGAALLHAACGLRCGLASCAALSWNSRGAIWSCVLNFAAAVSLHTLYNFMAPRGGIFTVLAMLLALSSLASGLRRYPGA